MEEIDKIIIDSLKHLECDFEEDIESLKQFDANLVLAAVSSCLELIIPNQKFPKKLPESMSLKIKIASSLAQQIKDLGFRGDMGYQTILYCNEVEVRRMLMFLIERLPRDSSKSVQIEEAGYVPRLIRQFEGNLKNYLKELWLPTCVLNKGMREINNGFIVNSFGNASKLKSVKLDISNSTDNTDDAEKQYWNHIVLPVTSQCSSTELIPSLLFKDNDYLSFNTEAILHNTSNEKLDSDELLTVKIEAETNTSFDDEEGNKIDEVELKIRELVKNLEILKLNYSTLQDKVKVTESALKENLEKIEREEAVRKEKSSKAEIQERIKAIKDEQSIDKLRDAIESQSETLLKLANEWNQVQTPLLDEYKTLQNSLSSEELKQQEEKQRLKHLKETRQNILTDLKEKEILEQILLKKLQQVNKSNNRLSYTRRIMEIIGNIKKQNIEIQKILKDTKEVQKDINNLTGQVDRSFTLSDELIFQDAKEDETARKAYKLLAALREECGNILKAVSDLGSVERESRNLEEQVETEKTKDVSEKLQRVYIDLAEMKKEVQLMEAKQNNHISH